MLHDFIVSYRDRIIERTRGQLTQRAWPAVSTNELENGVPLFLSQLTETLRLESGSTPFPEDAIGTAAAVHGRELRALGFTVSQVVHDYGDVCQAITAIALEEQVPVSIDEFHTLNRCLDTAIAEAVTEYARLTAICRDTEEVERLGQVGHEVRDFVNTAMMAYQALKRGNLGINGSTGAVLGRSLVRLSDFIGGTLSEVRLSTQQLRRERFSVASFLSDIVAASLLHAEYHGLQFNAATVSPELTINVDPQLLASAVTNLINNAFKFSIAGGSVSLSARRDAERVVIAVRDSCGGIPAQRGDPFEPFGERRGRDRSGLGLGLSIARKAVRLHGGDIHVQNMPGVGCTFSVEVPLATAG